MSARTLTHSIAWAAILALLLFRPALAQIWDVQKLVAQSRASDPNHQVALASPKETQYVRVAHLRRLLEVHQRVSAVASTHANLKLVVSPVLNALAIYRPPTIAVSSAMLGLVGDDEHMIAALIGHEYAHIGLRHGLRKGQRRQDHARKGLQTGRQVALESGSTAEGLEAAKLAFLLLQADYSRQHEIEADKVGTELVARAKYDPDGTIRLFRAMLARVGSQPTSYLDTHPGLEERIAQAEPAVMDEHFRLLADRLERNQSWVRLLRMADYWLQASETSARAWYYRGVSLKALGRPGALQAFERAVSHDTGIPAARLALCIELYQHRSERESLLCSEHLRPEHKELFEARTFGHRTYVYGVSPSQAGDRGRLRIIRD